ncbi:tripartite tricarboxylate transporter substrate binding protein [Rhodopseudomonas boonkerdii]|uniref:Bug family tripartite tricarboxylate transporter substrate binding protein n=1 Tax=Rhodopseudomonas boonkerdii TaxID=475937 RepID=UPI001E54A2C0|nr:tripartite tricarboxylate transporter substrate-binding protein [Rhodopseudomonas boonkerdii]UGV24550.1 tripartite tricarboxylate transporter substrate binding protein [Rhodopseudomonas boonkerdii]
MDRRQFMIGSGLAATAAMVGSQAAAQTYPTQLVRIVVPFSGGSMTDILARTVAEKLSAKWKQQVIVENRPGIAGVSSIAKGPADGSQIMLTSNGHSVVGVVNKNLGFDPVKDFVAISRVATTAVILIVPPDAPFKTLAEFISAAKAKPDGLSYSSAGVGSSTGIAAELFKHLTGTKMVLVPHRGQPESQVSVMRGDTSMAFTFFNVGGDLIQSGKLRALAVTGKTRLPQLPDVPTFAEAGLPDFAYDSWFGMLAAGATPKPIVSQIARDLAETLTDPALIQQYQAQGVTITSSAPEAFGAELRSDAERYGKLVAAASG